VYAECAAKGFTPASGVLGEYDLPLDEPDTRFESWTYRGATITPNYDPLIVKILQWAPTRSECCRRLHRTLSKSNIRGPPNNLEFLTQYIASPQFTSGNTFTNTLSSFDFNPRCLEVLRAGLNVTVQDYPGRTGRGLWRIGVPPSGPMDHLNARLANSLVDNDETAAVLEVILQGPALKFHANTIVSVAGAPFDVRVNGIKAPMYAALRMKPGDELSVGVLTTEVGARCYIAVHGGIDVPLYLGSRSTFVNAGFGGYQGKVLAAGDVMDIGKATRSETMPLRKLAKALQPVYSKDWVAFYSFTRSIFF
jgi:urea carboxylase